MNRASFLFVFLCCACVSRGQNSPPKKVYFSLKAGPSFLFTGTKSGMEQVSFPYMVKTQGGNSGDSLFVSHPFTPLNKIQTAIFITLELGNYDHFFELNFGGYTSLDNGSFISFGYGKNIHVSMFQKRQTRLPDEGNFVIKPSLHIGYNNFNTQIGSFNNLNKYNVIGSYASGPTFTESNINTDNFTSSTSTYTTQSLTIAYLQRSCVLSAQVAFGNNPYKHIFHWEIVAGAYLSATEAIGVKFVQQASDGNSKSSDFYAIGTNGTSATFNGAETNKVPYLFSGFKIGFNVGISTGPPKK
jgi:hypothetical protein